MDTPSTESTNKPEDAPVVSLERGTAIIKDVVKDLTGSSGVYRMFNAKGDLLYVGKARNLKKRVNSYTSPGRLPTRLKRMIAETSDMEITTTRTEAEALLLECKLIKSDEPRYNVLLRDDKSFPFIFISDDHDFPQALKHRGAHKRKGAYFGPYLSAGAVNKTMTILQKAFLLRNCSDSYFENRTRPCLQYHIKRCSAPCVGYVDKKGYARLVKQAQDFLAGKSTKIKEELSRKMQKASDELNYETAAVYRNRIQAITQIQSSHATHTPAAKDTDVMAIHKQSGQACIQVFFFRNGQLYGNNAYFPKHQGDIEEPEIISAFIGQFYQNKPVPKQIFVNTSPESKTVLTEILSDKRGSKVFISQPERGAGKRMLDDALSNAKLALNRYLTQKTSQQDLLEKLQEVLERDTPITRIEVYDNSHTGGQGAQGAMIVAGPEGFEKKAYRKFNIQNTEISAGDDYAMMREVLTRRFNKQDEEAIKNWPQVVLIDGGQGQLTAALEVFDELNIREHADITLAAVAKGPDRNAGREKLFLPETAEPLELDRKDPALYFIQRLRDEAHRFAISGHRARRQKSMVKSALDEIPGIGGKRKKALLLHFGSVASIAGAGIEDLMKVEGIHQSVAQRIYDYFHQG